MISDRIDKLSGKLTWHEVQSLLQDDLEPLPCDVRGGIYILLRGYTPLYVGQSDSVLSRIGSHIKEARMDFDKIMFARESDYDRRLTAEGALIRALNPSYNYTRDKNVSI